MLAKSICYVVLINTCSRKKTKQKKNIFPFLKMEKYTMLFAKLTTCFSVREDAEKREPSYTVGGNVNGAATMENSMDSPQKVKSRTTI